MQSKSIDDAFYLGLNFNNDGTKMYTVNGGNAILIDVENSRIVVLNSLHYNRERFKYSHKKLLLDPIKNGRLN